jgi:hypothetical protein
MATHARPKPGRQDGRGDKEAPAPSARTGPEPLPSSGNLSLQDWLHNGLLHRRLTVGSTSDPAEAEADRMADAALKHDPAGAAPSGKAAGSGTTVRRKPRMHDLLSSAPQVTLAGGRPLGKHERDYFEPRFNADLGDVRVHDDHQAAASAAGLNARAFSLGNRIVFGAGEYQPDSAGGQRLLAHELAHVLQGDQVIRRVPVGPMCTAQPAPKPETQMCRAPAVEDPANPSVLDLNGTLEERVAAFKELVKTTTIHRLMDNRANLVKWADQVENNIPSGDIAAMGMLQSGASGPYFELQQQSDPMMRELRASQALGQFRACTGCHLETQITASRAEREALAFNTWQTPDQMRAGIRPTSSLSKYESLLPSKALTDDLAGFGFDSAALPARAPLTGPAAYNPPAGSNEARLHRLFPDPDATRAALKRAAPIMQALGPDGYQVLPKDMLEQLENASAGKIRTLILDAIATRRENYLTLIGKIRDGEIGYEFFGPVVKKLLPLADKEVRAAIQEEMDSKHFWEKVEQVVVAALTALTLILMIFPPTTALGVAAFASLEISLGYYGIQKGQEAIKLGEAFALGVGANDVFTQEQQRSADAMILSGWLGVAGGYLGVGGGLARTASIARFMPPPSVMGPAALADDASALVKTGTGGVARTIQQGEYVMTIAEDGTMMATISSRPDLLIMVRGEVATLYQLLEGGGMRVVARATIPARGAGGGGGMPLLTAGGDTAGMPLMSGAADLPALGGAIDNPPLALPGQNFDLPLLMAGDEAAVVGAAPARQGPLITPPPREPLQLNPGNPTTHSWDEISRMRQPNLWENREAYMQQLYGAPGQQHFPVAGTGGRYVDVPVQYGGGRFYFAGEVKSYNRWVGVPGQRGGILNEVPLSGKIQTQLERDIWLRDNVPGYDPRWMFTDAPPSAELRQALRDNNIVFIEYF